MPQTATLLIIDDDEIIREGLARNIPWEAHGFKVIGTARNGAEGLQLARECHPRLILSDIRMPFMDGLQMAEAVKNFDPTVKIIFLTGYDEFEYAKKALSLRASDYILKYADNEEILKAVIKTNAEWQKESQWQGIMDRGQLVLREKYLRELLLAETAVPDFREKEQEINLDLQGKAFGVAVVKIEPVAGGASRLNNESWPSLVRDSFSDDTLFCEAVPLPQKIALIFGTEKKELHSMNFLEKLLTDVYQKLTDQNPKYQFLLGVGEGWRGILDVAQSYREALSAFEIQNTMGQGGIIFFHQIGESENQLRFRKILEYIQSHFGDPDLSLTKLAKEINICPAYISTIFKKYRKLNFSEYLIGLRMDKARELLTKTNLMTYEVAEKTGYMNPQYFSVLFKKYTGMTPTECKNRCNS
jgi:two-component system response regulator YesN